MRSYSNFLYSKAHQPIASGREPDKIHPSLYPFQRAIVEWAVKRGRAAVFADCGLGKTRIQVEWIRQMGARGLIVCPLAVADQTIREAIEVGVPIRFAHEPSGEDGIEITNYEKLHKFIGAKYDAIVLDESSILKSYDGKTRTLLIREFSKIPNRLCCTATPAPNDVAELANHSEFLGIMSRVEMLATFFVHDSDGWRLKGHAQDAFWRWMVSWALYVRLPSDLGFDDEGFKLPALSTHRIVVDTDWKPDGMLFSVGLQGIQARSEARRATLPARVDAASDLIKTKRGTWLVWVGLNDEGRALKDALGDRAVLIEGSDAPDVRLSRHAQWRSGDARVLISKPSIFGWGMNWQHCRQMMFVGLSDSYESYYQAVRRCWRFGQKRPVNVWIVTSEPEKIVLENVMRKTAEAEALAAGVIEHMRDLEIAEVRGAEKEGDVYDEDQKVGDRWRMVLGDSCERLKDLKDDSVGLSVFSPPFASLYTYSASDRDLGNSATYDQFFVHFDYIIHELLRVTMPARRACVHVQQVSTTKVTHGVIGWRDFRADTVRAFVDAGWVYDGEVVIDKDPQAQAIRTKSKALMFVQKNKDSTWSRPAMADYILLFRKDGENPEPIETDVTNEEWIRWARPIWYGIKETETLNVAEARESKDERHICPLQLETIRRCIRLWSNPSDLVIDPFAGIGSTGYESILLGRRFFGIELKRSYFDAAIRNLRHAEQQSLGDLFTGVKCDR